MKNFLKNWLPLLIYATAIFRFSNMPKPLPEVKVVFFDKFLHMAAYTIFGFLASRAFRNSSIRIFVDNFIIFGILAATLYGVSDEFHQSFIPGRECCVFDMIADSIGGVLGAFFYSVIRTKTSQIGSTSI